MNRVTAPGRVPPQPGQEKEEPEQSFEDDIPARDHDPDGTPPDSASHVPGERGRRSPG